MATRSMGNIDQKKDLSILIDLIDVTIERGDDGLGNGSAVDDPLANWITIDCLRVEFDAPREPVLSVGSECLTTSK